MLQLLAVLSSSSAPPTHTHTRANAQIRAARHEVTCYTRALAELQEEGAAPMSEVCYSRCRGGWGGGSGLCCWLEH